MFLLCHCSFYQFLCALKSSAPNMLIRDPSQLQEMIAVAVVAVVVEDLVAVVAVVLEDFVAVVVEDFVDVDAGPDPDEHKRD